MRAATGRVYALDAWTIEQRSRGWYIRRTYAPEKRLGPYRSEASACLMIARQLRREIARRAAPKTEPRV